MTLLQSMAVERGQRREVLRQELRARLRTALARLLPAERVVVFGSLTKKEEFNEFSDVDLALEREPPGLSIYQLTGLLMEELGRPVDIIILSESRFRDRVLNEGEVWILPA